QNLTLTDATRRSGDAVTPADPDEPCVIVFRHVRLGPAAALPATGTFAVAGGPGRVEIRAPGVCGTVTVPATGGKYQWTELSTQVALPGGTGDLSVVLHGPVRLAWFRLGRG